MNYGIAPPKPWHPELKPRCTESQTQLAADWRDCKRNLRLGIDRGDSTWRMNVPAWHWYAGAMFYQRYHPEATTHLNQEID